MKVMHHSDQNYSPIAWKTETIIINMLSLGNLLKEILNSTNELHIP